MQYCVVMGLLTQSMIFLFHKVENNVRREENAGYQHFLLRQCFYPFPKQALVFTCLQYKSFENTGKRRNCS